MDELNQQKRLRILHHLIFLFVQSDGFSMSKLCKVLFENPNTAVSLLPG
jgi:hypothetical protein